MGKKKHGDRTRGLQPVGLQRRSKDRVACGLCGVVDRMSRTHVPPQCAGNRDIVARSTLVSKDQVARQGHALNGGLYVYGLCAACNGLQSRYDRAYGELATALRGLWARSWLVRLPNMPSLPAADIRPGAVARSVLIGFFGVNPKLRELFPQLAASLIARDQAIILPRQMRLRLALARGPSARLGGPVGGMFLFGPRMNDRPLGFNNFAHLYFPPLAWQLTADEPSLLDVQRWAEVSEWLTRGADDVAALTALCPTLPVVAHPLHHPSQAEHWVEMFSGEITEIFEARGLPADLLHG
ncbi:hypothetical protein AB0B31_10820 [Catellatospora citrea]|uniref:hypothetical protein n=1 Tax=Catellatospora citrea TaxID=53366 RepID=UPI003401FCD8